MTQPNSSRWLSITDSHGAPPKARSACRAAPRAGIAALALLVAAAALLPASSADARRRSRRAPAQAELAVADAAQPALAGPLVSVLSLDFDPQPGATVIGLTGSGPLTSHTVYETSPETLVLEISGVDVSQLPLLAEIGTPEVESLTLEPPGEDTARSLARFTLRKASGTRREVGIDPRDPNRLVLTIAAVEPAAPAADDSTGRETPAASAPPRILAAAAIPTVLAEPAATPAPAPRAAIVHADPVSTPEPTRSSERPARSTAGEPRSTAQTARPEPVVSAPALPEPGPRLGARVASRDALAAGRVLGTSATDVGRPVVPVAAASGPARLLEASLARGSDGRMMLRLVGDRPLEVQAFALENPPRLALDLPRTINHVTRGRRSVGEGGVSRVRVAQNQPLPTPVTRIVLDLDEAMAWEIIPGPTAVLVALGDAPSASSAPAMAAATEPRTGGLPASLQRPSEPVMGSSVPAAATATQPLVTYADLGRPTTFSGQSAPPSQALRETARSGPGAGSIVSGAASTISGASGGGGGSLTGGAGGGGGGSAASGGATFQTQQLTQTGEIYVGDPISINMKGADLEDLFRLFAQYGNLNIILDPSVRGKQITLVLDEVPWDQALALVLKTQGLGSVLEGNVLRVAPLGKLAQEEAQKRQLAEAQELSGELVSVARTLSYASGQAAQQIVQRNLSPRGSVVLDKRTNTLIIKDLESRMEELERLLALIDQRTRQVMIEARIVETTKDFSKGWGLNWGFTYLADRAFGNQTGFSFPRSIAADYAVNLPVQGATTSLGLSFRNILNTFALDVAIQALEDRGRARVISRPMVMVQNNEEAEIESGVQIPITTTTATEVDVQFVSASLKLTVTPQITADDNVIMDIEVENNAPNFLVSSGDNPGISTRQASTVVRVPDGGTTVIGGIYQVNEGVSSSRTPFLSRIPILGWLFRNKRIDRTNDELLIFLTPRIQA